MAEKTTEKEVVTEVKFVEDVKEEPIPEPQPFIVEGSETNVIITNNMDTNLVLEVTYSFGIGEQNMKIFSVPANNKASFRVFNNNGCDTCSVKIISYNQR